ncbi:MAG: quinoprotein relay system zinc metallohydrolase 2 [Pseudomonadota bacterium]
MCLDLADGPCRDQLLPGYEAMTQAACTASLRSAPPQVSWSGEQGAPQCVTVAPPLSVDQVAPGIFVHMGRIAEPDQDNRGDVANMGFIVGEDSVAVIDTGAARWLGEGLWRAIRARTDKPVSHVILTHMHPDHVFGVSVFADAGAKVVGHGGLGRALADRQANYTESLNRLIGAEAMIGTELRPIDITVEDAIDIDLGGRLLRLQAWPAAHTRVDITVTDLETSIMFAGDLVFHRHTPALDGKLRGWQAVLAEMARLSITKVVPGHGGPLLSWPEGAAAQQAYLQTLEKDARQAVHEGQRLGDAVETIAASEAAKWELFEAFNPRNATVAYTELEWE